MMRVATRLSGLILLAVAVAAPAQTLRQGPVTRDEPPGPQASSARDAGWIVPDAPPPRKFVPSTAPERDDVAKANAQAAEKARADAAMSIDKVKRNKDEAERYARERAAYEAELLRVRQQKEAQDRAYADAMARWAADREACLDGDFSRCANTDGGKRKKRD